MTNILSVQPGASGGKRLSFHRQEHSSTNRSHSSAFISIIVLLPLNDLKLAFSMSSADCYKWARTCLRLECVPCIIAWPCKGITFACRKGICQCYRWWSFWSFRCIYFCKVATLAVSKWTANVWYVYRLEFMTRERKQLPNCLITAHITC